MNRSPGPNAFPPNQPPQVQIVNQAPIQLSEQQQASIPLDNTMANLVIDECQRMWSTVVLDVLKNLKSRAPNMMFESKPQSKLQSKLQSKNRNRSKRDSFTGAALKAVSNVILGGAVTNLVSTIWNRFDPHSNEHRITKIEESQTDVLDQIDQFQEKFNLTSEILDVVIGDVQNLAHRTRHVEYQINHLVQLILRMTWTTTYVQTRMMTMASNLKAMIDEYSHGRVACKEVAELLRIPELELVSNEWTFFESIERVQDNRTKVPIFLLKFNVNNIEPNSFIYRVQSFRYWDHLTETPVLMEYKGYNWLMHNESSNCLLAIEEPSEVFLQVGCIEANHTDPRLQLWDQIAETQDIYKYNHTCQVRKLASYNYIYCFPFNITTVMGTFRNPPHVFRLPGRSFSIADGDLHPNHQRHRGE